MRLRLETFGCFNLCRAFRILPFSASGRMGRGTSVTSAAKIVSMCRTVGERAVFSAFHIRILHYHYRRLGSSGSLNRCWRNLPALQAFRLPSAIGLAHLFRGLAKVSKWRLVSWFEFIARLRASLRVDSQYQVQEVSC
jgi:hypothetical protein